MNAIHLIGNLTRPPETRTTNAGKNVCTFTVAVNTHQQGRDADFFKINCWNKLAELAQKYLDKGRKVAVSGSVSCEAYLDKQGQPKAVMVVTAQNIEFLSPKAEDNSGMGDMGQGVQASNVPQGFTQASEDELPFDRGLGYP